MNWSSFLAMVVLMVFPCSSFAFELPEKESFHNGLSLQGFTGILNTPSAHVTQEGDFYALYTNQKESKWRDRTRYQDNYYFNVGMFSIAEIGGRLTWAPEVGAQDLSANVKLTSEPFFRKYPYMPVLALGMQDVSGGASFFKSKYAVISEDIWRLRLSAGYGHGPDRMKGMFAGGEFKAHDWLYLLADYDTDETNVGARVVLPHFWKIPISFTATAKTSIDHKPGNIDIGFGLSLPLDFKVRKQQETVKVVENIEPVQSSKIEIDTKPLGREPETSSINSQIKAVQGSTFKVEPGILNIEPGEWKSESQISNIALPALRERLIKAGFQNVRVGEKNNSVAVIEYENVTFNHNELDALGVITGMAVETLPDSYRTLRLIIKKKNIRMMQVSMPLAAAADYLKTGHDLADFTSQVSIRNSFSDDDEFTFVEGSTNSSMFATSLMLWPGLNTWVGTDYSAFDYVLSLKPELFTNLWSGALINARWDIPLFWSENLKEGRPFRNGRTPGRMERLMLFQGIKLFPGLMLNLGGGMLTPDLNGTMNEAVWQPDGSHRIRLAQAWGRNDKTRRDMESFLASYRYYFSPLDLSLEGTAGKFWSQDRGFTLELKRFFGDAAVSLYYKNTTIDQSVSQGLPTHWQAVGIQFAFPLTPEKDMKHYYRMQLRGTEEWRYAQETVIAGGNSANANYLPPVPLAVAPVFTGSLHNQYLNRDRLNESYMKSHLDRLREAWLKYGTIKQ